MDPLVLLLRLVHIVTGAVWVGMAVFTAFFLVPALQDSGPEAGKVMVALQRRGILIVMPILALATVLSGFWLYWRVSAGLQTSFLSSPIGMALGLGGILALLGFALGMIVTRPAMSRAAALSQTLATLAPPERETRLAEIQRLRARGAAGGRIMAVMLILAASGMAVARYL